MTKRARFARTNRHKETMPERTAEVPNDADWMTAAEAGRALGVHRTTVLQRGAKGLYRMRTVGGVPFVNRSDVDAAVRAARRKAKVA